MNPHERAIRNSYQVPERTPDMATSSVGRIVTRTAYTEARERQARDMNRVDRYGAVDLDTQLLAKTRAELSGLVPGVKPLTTEEAHDLVYLGRGRDTYAGNARRLRRLEADILVRLDQMARSAAVEDANDPEADIVD